MLIQRWACNRLLAKKRCSRSTARLRAEAAQQLGSAVAQFRTGLSVFRRQKVQGEYLAQLGDFLEIVAQRTV